MRDILYLSVLTVHSTNRKQTFWFPLYPYIPLACEMSDVYTKAAYGQVLVEIIEVQMVSVFGA